MDVDRKVEAAAPLAPLAGSNCMCSAHTLAQLDSQDSLQSLSALAIHSPTLEGDEKKAEMWLRKAAMEWPPEAQWQMGNFYYQGAAGVEVDVKMALEWWKLAAERNHVVSQCRLATVYWRGQEVGKNPEEAVRWLKRAVTQKSEKALLKLCLYDPENYKLDDVLRLLPEEPSDPETQVALAHLYLDGSATPKNTGRAIEWSKKAAAQNNAKAQFILSQLCEGPEADEWLKKAAENGSDDAQFKMALRERESAQKKMEWAIQAANQGHMAAEMYVGAMYYNGEHVKKDHTRAMMWYKRAAQRRVPHAYYMLHLLDPAHKVKWLQLAAAVGHPSAMYALGVMHTTGQGVEKDDCKALQLHEKAAKLRESRACFSLYKRYRYGHGVRCSASQSLHWLLQSAMLNNKKAKEHIIRLYYRDSPLIVALKDVKPLRQWLTDYEEQELLEDNIG